MNDKKAHEFYKDPEHLRPAGPAAHRLVRPGLRELRYQPPACGPQTWTVNAGLRRFWQKLTSEA